MASDVAGAGTFYHVEAAFILALGLHHGYWVNLKQSPGLADTLATVRVGQEVELYNKEGQFRKTLKVMDKNDRPMSLKVMDPDGDHHVNPGDQLRWQK